MRELVTAEMATSAAGPGPIKYGPSCPLFFFCFVPYLFRFHPISVYIISNMCNNYIIITVHNILSNHQICMLICLYYYREFTYTKTLNYLIFLLVIYSFLYIRMPPISFTI